MGYRGSMRVDMTWGILYLVLAVDGALAMEEGTQEALHVPVTLLLSTTSRREASQIEVESFSDRNSGGSMADSLC